MRARRSSARERGAWVLPRPCPRWGACPRRRPRPRPRPRTEADTETETERGAAALPGVGAERDALAVLASHVSLSAAEMAEASGVGVDRARRGLNRMIERGEASRYRDGRAFRYFAIRRGERPDLGLVGEARVVVEYVDETRAWAIANAAARTKVLGVIGADERAVEVTLVHRALIRVDFEETVEAPLIQRVLGIQRRPSAGHRLPPPHDARSLDLPPRAGRRVRRRDARARERRRGHRRPQRDRRAGAERVVPGDGPARSPSIARPRESRSSAASPRGRARSRPCSFRSGGSPSNPTAENTSDART